MEKPTSGNLDSSGRRKQALERWGWLNVCEVGVNEREHWGERVWEESKTGLMSNALLTPAPNPHRSSGGRAPHRQKWRS